MEQLNQARAGDPTSLKSIRRFYRFLGDRGKSLEASRLLFQSSSETAIEVISDLIALQRIREALSMALAHNLISSTEESSLLTTLESANSHPAINKSTRQAFNTLNIFPHFEDENFNPIQPEHITNKETSTICVIHVGKCAGESVIEALKQSFPEDYFRVIEYHIFDADQLLKNIIPKTTESKNIHWVILSRDPITRWISAFNWDYHLYHLNKYFYCHETAKKYFSRYQNCLELCRAIQNEQDEAIHFSRFNHLTFGHMAMGQAWYLSEDLINQMDPEKTSLIRIEQISEDFESCIKKIRNQFRFAKAFKAKLTPTKNKYQNRYERHTFKKRHDFSDQDVKNLRMHLSDDCKIAQLMRERFVT